MTRLAIAAVMLAAACSDDPIDNGPIDEATAEARIKFPDVERLYAGEHGIYRGCGPNGGVCHNANEFPNLDSIGSILDNIGRDCNQKRDDPTTLHDLCERAGDFVQVINDTDAIEIAYFEPADTAAPPRIWKMHLRDAPTEAIGTYDDLPIYRGAQRDETLFHIGYYMQSMAMDPLDPTGRTIVINLNPPPAMGFDGGAYMAGHLANAGVPADPYAIQVGDANRNGTFGVELEGKIIKPGDPLRSYMLRRLTDPNAGPLMPRANCCFWTKASLRALWCWISGLQPDGANALSPIDYDACPASPSVELLYPLPGPECENSGMCPVEAGGGTGDATFSSIYTEIMVTKCDGSGCHFEDQPGGGVDMTSIESAYTTLFAKVVPGDPTSSALYRRLFPDTCQAPCDTMPLGRPLLPDADRERIRMWIEGGALREPAPQ
jgi:hypothetical protein